MATDGQWFGVTYPQDKEGVMAKIAQYKEDDIYPFDLFSVDIKRRPIKKKKK